MRILKMLFALFVMGWVARYLGKEDFGILQYGIAFAGLFGPLAILGLPEIGIRDIVNEPEARDEILGTIFVLRLTGGLIGFILVLVTIYFVREEPTVRLITGIAALTLFLQAFESIDIWFQSKVQSKYTVIAKSVSLVVANLLRILAILTLSPVTAFAVILAISSVITGGGLIIAYRSQGLSLSKWRFRWSRAKDLLSQSWMLVLTGTLSVIYFNIYQVMLGQRS